MTQQPDWKYVCNLWDAMPIDYGGDFLYVDATWVYPPEIEKLVPPNDDVIDTPRARWTVYRFMVEPCTYINGILSDNKYHPGHAAWFANPYNPDRPQDGKGGLEELSSYIGVSIEELVAMFRSKDVRTRAAAWLAAADYHGIDNFDSYPLKFNREEIEKRYEDEERIDAMRRNDHKVFRRVWAHHPRGGLDYGYATDVRKGLYSPERGICISVEHAAIGGGMSCPEVQVTLADANDPLDPLNQECTTTSS